MRKIHYRMREKAHGKIAVLICRIHKAPVAWTTRRVSVVTCKFCLRQLGLR